MKLLINPQPPETSSQPLPEDWHFIKQPKPRQSLILSFLIGLALFLIPFLLLSLQAWLSTQVDARQIESIPGWIFFPVLLVTIGLHESLHLFCHPGWGLSKQSLLLIWARKLSLGVYYEGYMSRRRWLLMRLTPLLGLTVLPTFILLSNFRYELSFFWEQFIVLVIMVNSLGSGGDLLASVIVSIQVPGSGEIGNWDGRACWRVSAPVVSENSRTPPI